MRVKTRSKALIDKTTDLNERNFLICVLYIRLLLNFIAICYVCIYLIILPNFNHRMTLYARSWFAADKPFIKRRRYVMLWFVTSCKQATPKQRDYRTCSSPSKKDRSSCKPSNVHEPNFKKHVWTSNGKWVMSMVHVLKKID